MTIAVNDKLDPKKSDFSNEDRNKINNSFEKLNKYIEHLCKNLYISESDSGRLKAVYNDGRHRFENHALPKPDVKSPLEPPTIVISSENFDNLVHDHIANNPMPFLDPNAQFMLPPMFGQNPFNFLQTGSHAPVISIDIPMYANIPITDNVNDIIQNAISNSTFNNNL